MNPGREGVRPRALNYRGLISWMFFLPGLDSSQPLLPRHCGHSWLLHPMAITNLVLSLSPISNSTLRPWTAAVETLEICLSESRPVLSCCQLSQLYSAPVHLHTSSFPPKSLSPQFPHPEDLTSHFNEATMLQLFHLYSLPLQTTLFTEGLFLSDIRRNSSKLSI